MYQSGDLVAIAEDDPKFKTEKEAIDYAIQESDKKNVPYGVWDIDDGYRLIYIAYEEWLYRE